jgi:hypothetical protein
VLKRLQFLQIVVLQPAVQRLFVLLTYTLFIF